MTGAVGRRIAALAGLSVPLYLRRTERVNLFDTYEPGWDAKYAWERADDLLPRLNGRRVLVLGARVAAAFEIKVPVLSWIHAVDAGGRAEFDVAILPHPSGLNRWYNTAAHRAQAALFLKDALA